MTIDTGYQSEHWTPDPDVIRHALEQARAALESPTAADDLAAYYASESNYAGRTFTALEPGEPESITAADLLAVTTLSVEVGPQAIRNFIAASTDVATRLAALDPALRLETIDPASTAEAMASFYDLVKQCLRRAGAQRGNAWVTASKVCARKRPNLFPVRDNLVLELLGLPKTYPVDWPAFQALVADVGLMDRLDQHVADAGGRDGVDLGDPTLRLRHLDVVLWMRARSSV